MKPPVKHSLGNHVWLAVLMFVCRVGTMAILKIRCYGRENMPRTGGGMVLSNHQSHLDPILVAVACGRRLTGVTRATLFDSRLFRILTAGLAMVSIDRKGGGLAAIKEILKRIKRGEMILLFPEGTRSPDGEVHALMPGFCAIARRAGVPLIPVAFDGAFDAWPRHRLLPRAGVVHVRWGDPIEPDEIDKLNDKELVAEVERRIRACHDACRRSRRRAIGRE